MKKIILTLGGGLGNQMFEYAFVRSIQSAIGGEIYLNLYHVSQYMNNSLRLQNLNIRPVRFCNKWQTNYYRCLQYIKNLIIKNTLQIKKVNENRKFEIMAEHGMVIAPHNYWGKIPDTLKGKVIFVYGTFQSYQSYINIKDELKVELKVSTDPSKENAVLINEIVSKTSVCVHIRRGDYVENKRWDNLNICSYNYYKKAFEEICSKVQNPTFYVFSNSSSDIKWIKENYDFSDYSVRYIELNNPDYEELRLMYSCKHFIISNSTFSWWAQCLSDNPDKIVVAPSIWNRIDDASEIYMDFWNIIDP